VNLGYDTEWACVSPAGNTLAVIVGNSIIILDEATLSAKTISLADTVSVVSKLPIQQRWQSNSCELCCVVGSRY
jgi:hypothetical protein